MSDSTVVSQPHASADGENDQTVVNTTENLEPEETVLVPCGCSFPYLLLQALVHLSIYIHKLSEDGYSVSTYYKNKQTYYCIISVLCLFVPSLVYCAYLVADSVLDKRTPVSEICTKIVHGMLLMPWQIKGHVEVLHYAAQRVCRCGAPTKAEHTEIRTLERETFVLEFFEDFYAGFIQLLLQLYLVVLFTNASQPSDAIVGQLVGSALSLYSLVKAVQRRDDGILTRSLAYVGWLSVTASRGLALSLLTSVIHGWIVVACLLHASVMTAWITSFVRGAHRRLESVRSTPNRGLLPRPVVIVALVFSLFGLPSLIFWPIMFDFKIRRRVFVFLFTLLLENMLCFGAWHLWGTTGTSYEHVVLISALLLGFTAGGVLFIALYSCCKPEKTDLVALQHIREENVNRYGIYFDFCKVIRILPDTQDIARDLEKIRMINLTN